MIVVWRRWRGREGEREMERWEDKDGSVNIVSISAESLLLSQWTSSLRNSTQHSLVSTGSRKDFTVFTWSGLKLCEGNVKYVKQLHTSSHVSSSWSFAGREVHLSKFLEISFASRFRVWTQIIVLSCFSSITELNIEISNTCSLKYLSDVDVAHSSAQNPQSSCKPAADSEISLLLRSKKIETPVDKKFFFRWALF